MALTASVRRWYPEPVVGVDRDGDPICDHRLRPDGPAVLVNFPSRLTSASHVPLKVHFKQKEAWQAYVLVMEALGVQIADGDSGTANCRTIANRVPKRVSLHAHLSAFDLLPITVQTEKFVKAVEAIRCKGSSEPVFLRGVNFDDPMHWQMNVPPMVLAAGIDWTTVLGSQEEDELAFLSEEAQKWLQAQYEDSQKLKNPDGTPQDPAKPTSFGYLLRKHREEARLTGIPGNEPEKIAAKTVNK